MNKKTFFKFNCYDEDFCGLYGEDLFYRRYIMANNAHFINLGTPILGQNELLNEHNLSRDDKAIKKKLSKMDKLIHKKHILNFSWEYICSGTYQNPIVQNQAVSYSKSRGGILRFAKLKIEPLKNLIIEEKAA